MRKNKFLDRHYHEFMICFKSKALKALIIIRELREKRELKENKNN